MLTQDITDWLENPEDYQTGLVLLRETGYGKYTLTILEMGADTYNRNRLEMELRAYLQKNVSRSEPAARSTPKDSLEPLVSGFQTKPVPVPPEMSEILTLPVDPPGVTDLRQQTYSLQDERSAAKAFLRGSESLGNTDEAIALRAPYALRIRAITRQLDEIFSRLKFYEQHGYLPPLASDTAVLVDDTTALFNARSYVSRYKKKLQKSTLTAEQRQSAEQLLKQYLAERDRLLAKLKSPINPADS